MNPGNRCLMDITVRPTDAAPALASGTRWTHRPSGSQ
jgi:hypothetical protein